MFLASMVCICASMVKLGYDIQKPTGITYRDGMIVFALATFALMLAL